MTFWNDMVNGQDSLVFGGGMRVEFEMYRVIDIIFKPDLIVDLK